MIVTIIILVCVFVVRSIYIKNKRRTAEVMICTKCGKQIDANDAFCAYCGAKNEMLHQGGDNNNYESSSPNTAGISTPYVANSSNTAAKSWLNTKIILPVALIILVFVIVVFVIGGSQSNNFSIEGKWQSVGSEGFGQAQPGDIVIFDGYRVNLYSPADTYTLTKEDGTYILRVVSVLGGDALPFVVNVISNDNIELYYGGDENSATELQRVE